MIINKTQYLHYQKLAHIYKINIRNNWSCFWDRRPNTNKPSRVKMPETTHLELLTCFMPFSIDFSTQSFISGSKNTPSVRIYSSEGLVCQGCHYEQMKARGELQSRCSVGYCLNSIKKPCSFTQPGCRLGKWLL